MRPESLTNYDADYSLWLAQNIDLLRQKQYDRLDWKNIIQELEELAKSKRRELKSRLATLFEHYLKLYCTDYSQDYRSWRITIGRTQKEILDLLTESPDYKNYPFPQECPLQQDIHDLLATNLWDDRQNTKKKQT